MDMRSLLDTITLLGPLDAAAVLFLIFAWFFIGWSVENPNRSRPSVSVLITHYRREWMHHAITREPRVFDAMIVTSLRQGTAFFASTAMIALGSGLALLPNIDRVTSVASELALGQTPRAVLELKLILVLAFVTDSFLKFVWSHRVFGYCSVLMGAMPNQAEDPMAHHRADQAADLNISAAQAFNRGLRSVYFALGALGWLLGAVPLMLTTLLTVSVIWRHEFTSRTRETLTREHLGDSA